VGKSECFFQGAGSTKESAMWCKAKELKPSLGKYGWPSRDAESEKKSFRLQCDRHVTSDSRYQPSEEEIKDSDKRVLHKYLRHLIPDFWHDLCYDSLNEAIEVFKNYLKADSTPGVPYAMMANRNDKLLEAMGSRFNDLVIERISNILNTSEEDIKLMSPEKLVSEGLMDPVRIFVKGENHKLAKLVEGRVRLIHSVSLVDKFIEMLCIRHLCKLEIANWMDIPSKPGIGFSHEDNERVYLDVVSKPGMKSTDIEAWDWNVDEWQILDDAEATIKLCANPTEQWKAVIRRSALMECKSLYQFSDGTLVKCNFNGIVNSGKFKTSRGNSFMRKRLADLVGAEHCNSAGDDTTESGVENGVEKYAKYGFKIKAYDDIIDSFEFCSRIYTKTGSWPVNAEKILMNLLHTTPKNQIEFRMYLAGFINDMQEHPEFNEYLDLIRSVGYFELVGAQEELDGDDSTTTTTTETG